MIQATASRPRKVRTLFLSDIHLGCQHAQTSALLDTLRRIEPERVYLVGDIVDARKLAHRWNWSPLDDAVLQRLLDWAGDGVPLQCGPGNHDDFFKSSLRSAVNDREAAPPDWLLRPRTLLREFLTCPRIVRADEFICELADGNADDWVQNYSLLTDNETGSLQLNHDDAICRRAEHGQQRRLTSC